MANEPLTFAQPLTRKSRLCSLRRRKELIAVFHNQVALGYILPY